MIAYTIRDTTQTHTHPTSHTLLCMAICTSLYAGMLPPVSGESVEALSHSGAQATEAVSHAFILPEFDHAIKAVTEASQKLQNEMVRWGYNALSMLCHQDWTIECCVRSFDFKPNSLDN